LTSHAWIRSRSIRFATAVCYIHGSLPFHHYAPPAHYWLPPLPSTAVCGTALFGAVPSTGFPRMSLPGSSAAVAFPYPIPRNLSFAGGPGSTSTCRRDKASRSQLALPALNSSMPAPSLSTPWRRRYGRGTFQAKAGRLKTWAASVRRCLCGVMATGCSVRARRGARKSASALPLKPLRTYALSSCSQQQRAPLAASSRADMTARKKTHPPLARTLP